MVENSGPQQDGQSPKEPFVPPWRKESIFRKVLWTLRARLEWIFMAIFAVSIYFLWGVISGTSDVPAYVKAKIYSVGSPTRGVLAQLLVEKGQKVKKGQVLAILDPSLLDADLTLAESQKKVLQSLLASTAVKFKLQQVNIGSRLQGVQDNARQGLLSGRRSMQSWQAELTELNREILWLSKLRQNRLGPTTRLGTLKARQKALSQLLQSTPRLLKFYRNKSYKARKLHQQVRQGTAKQDPLASILKPIMLQLERQELTIQKLKLLKRKLTLTAPIKGVVNDVRKRLRDPLEPSTTILTIVEDDPKHIIAYIQEPAARQVSIGTKVVAYTRAKKNNSFLSFLEKREKIHGKVVGLGEVGLLPGRFHETMRINTWVRMVIISIKGKHDLIPGERMFVSFIKNEKTSK